jgi:hypothetical protein
MSFVGDLVGDVFGGITGAKQAGQAAERAGATQAAAAQQGIVEQRRQFDKFVELMAPYVTAGTGALGGQQALLGLGGAGAQQQAIAGIEGSPQFQAMTQQGEGAILQNAAATGGLRGGNVQAALAQFRPQLLSDLINQQYSRLGGLTAMGQNAATNQGSAGQMLGANVSNLFGQQGAATAGGQIARGGVARQTFGDLLKIGGTIAGAGGFSGFGGGGSGLQAQFSQTPIGSSGFGSGLAYGNQDLGSYF